MGNYTYRIDLSGRGRLNFAVPTATPGVVELLISETIFEVKLDSLTEPSGNALRAFLSGFECRPRYLGDVEARFAKMADIEFKAIGYEIERVFNAGAQHWSSSEHHLHLTITLLGVNLD